MHLSEDEYYDLTSYPKMAKDDVAMFIERSDSLEELVSELKEYFNLDEEYYKKQNELKIIAENHLIEYNKVLNEVEEIKKIYDNDADLGDFSHEKLMFRMRISEKRAKYLLEELEKRNQKSNH